MLEQLYRDRHRLEAEMDDLRRSSGSTGQNLYTARYVGAYGQLENVKGQILALELMGRRAK